MQAFEVASVTHLIPGPTPRWQGYVKMPGRAHFLAHPRRRGRGQVGERIARERRAAGIAEQPVEAADGVEGGQFLVEGAELPQAVVRVTL